MRMLVALILGILVGPAAMCVVKGCYDDREHPERGCVRCGHFWEAFD